MKYTNRPSLIFIIIGASRKLTKTKKTTPVKGETFYKTFYRGGKCSVRERQKGATLVEVLVAIALTGVLLPALATALITSHAGRATTRQQLKAAALMQEAAEAVRVVRQADWSNIAADGTYHPVISGSTWTLAGGPETIDGFSRQVTIATAERDSGGAADPATKHVEIIVSWSQPYNGSVSEELYLSRWQDNTVWEQTAQADFTAGTVIGTAVTNTRGGEVELAAGTPAYQTSGTFESGTFDAGANAAFNYITFTASQPAGTTLQLQIAANTDNTTWNFAGPDGTGSTYFTAGAAIPPGAVDARYLRFKAFLTGDGNATPVLSDVTVNYSP